MLYNASPVGMSVFARHHHGVGIVLPANTLSRGIFANVGFGAI
jgi:hypothetical protein